MESPSFDNLTTDDKIFTTDDMIVYPKPPKEDIALILKHAYGLIEEGWCQGAGRKIVNERTYYCALGAIMLVIAVRLFSNEAVLFRT